MASGVGKLVLLILDGAADSPGDERTPLSEAVTPGLDRLASNAVCGFHYPVSPGVAPESDVATLSLLGYDPEKYYVGRGPFEALGAGLSLREGREVVFRANFATVDPATRRIIDRRVGRTLTASEARELARLVDGLRLSGGYARVKATVGHRAVVVIGSESSRLSANVQNIDPAYVRRGLVSEAVPNPVMVLPKCRPLDSSREAMETCRLVDEFVEKVISLLDSHPINVERERRGLLKANVLLLRDAGDRMPKLPQLSTLLGVGSAAAVAEMPVEVGIARAAGMRAYTVEPPSGSLERDMPGRLEAALKALEENDFVYIHLKGPDEPGHDGDFEGKKNAIEKIDEYFIQPLIDTVDLYDTAIIVTSDHATPWRLRSHSGDKVPWMLSNKRISGGPGKFSEKHCAAHGATLLKHGWQLLGHVMELLKKL